MTPPSPAAVPARAPYRVARRLLGAAAVLSGLFGILMFLYYWDPSRMLWRRLVEQDPYRYERLDPRYAAVDPADHITIGTEADLRRSRAALVRAIWGRETLPLDKRPVAVETVLPGGVGGEGAADCDRPPTVRTLDCALDLYRGMANLAGLDRITVAVDAEYRPRFAHFRPADGNGGLVVYHHGFAGTYHDQHRHIGDMVARGYAVIAHNLAGYGENVGPDVLAKERPVRYFVEPAIVGISYARERFGYEAVDMIGFSAGGWVAAVAAAVDPRIRRSYPVAAVFPLYLRRERETAPPQYDAAMLAAASYLDMFVLGASGAGRGQLQVFNRYDRCCFANTRGTLYEDAVRNAVSAIGPGRFAVVIDETHARHKVSAWAFGRILEDMERP